MHIHRPKNAATVLRLALVATSIYVVVTAVAGVRAHSLALISEAGHNLSDLAALGLSLVAVFLETRPANSVKTYGYHRAGVLAAFINAIALIGLSGYIFYEAGQRLLHPVAVHANVMMAVAAVGVVMNGVIALALHRSSHDVNIRSSFLHMLGDTVSTAAVIVGGWAILATGADWIDPALSFAIGGLILWSAWAIVRETLNILLEGMPRGVNSPVRAFGAVGGAPPMIVRGEGAYLFDADGNRYIDYVGSWGPLILGHAPPEVVSAIESAARTGTSFGASTPWEAELAEMITQAMPAIEMLRLVSSGTEATMSAIRLARAFTKRRYIVKFEGCYHGHADTLLVKAGSGVATLGIPGSAGVPEEATQFTLALPYNNVSAVETAFQKFAQQIACVIVEPVVGNMGCVPPALGYLNFLREVT